MAFSFTIDTQKQRVLQGRKHIVYELSALEIGADDLILIGVPSIFTITLFEVLAVDVTVTVATRIDVQIFLATDADPDTNLVDTLDHVGTLEWGSDTPGLYLRSGADQRITAKNEQLYIRIQPDAELDSATLRITLSEGHGSD